MSSELVQTATASVNFNHPFAAHVKILEHATARVAHDRKKVAIVGFAQATFRLAPFDNPDYEIWGVNQLYRHIPRADRWFEIHHNWNEFVVEGTDHQGWLAQAPIPIYMKDRVPGIPNSLPYPLAEICGWAQAPSAVHSEMVNPVLVNEAPAWVTEPNGVMAPVGTGQGLPRGATRAMPDYFTSSIAFMLALAIWEGFEVIDIYGVDLTVGEEYDYQKPCAEFWIGLAMGKGIEVGIPKGSALLHTAWRYGWESEPDWPIKMSEVLDRMKMLHNEHDRLTMALEQVKGALQNNQFYHDLLQARLRGSTIQILKGT